MFGLINNWFTGFFNNYAGLISAQLATALTPVALALVTAYIGIYGYAVMRGEASEPISVFAWKMVKILAITSFALGTAYYSTYILQGATQLQDGLALLFVAPGTPGTALGQFDTAEQRANELLSLLWRDASMWRLDLVLASVTFYLGTIILLTVGVFVSLVAKTIMAFTLAIGPLAIIGLIFKPTARFFDSWLSVLLSAIVLNWFVFFALGMSFFVMRELITLTDESGAFRSGAAAAAIPGGAAGALASAATYLVVMALLALLLYQAPQLASALTGGSSINFGGNMAVQAYTAIKASQAATGRGAGGGGTGGAGGGAMTRNGGAVYGAGRMAASASAGAAGVARAAYQRVAQRGRVQS